MLFILLFVVTMAISTGVYLFVYRTLDSRDAAKLRSRFDERAASSAPTAAPLFLPEGLKKDVLSRLLRKLSFDRRLQELVEQAGVPYTPGQIVLTSLLAGLVTFNLIWYLVPSLKILAFLAALAGAIFPYSALKRMKSRRIFAFEGQFPDALQFIARAMRAGHAFSVSLEMLHQEFAEPLGSEFRRTFEEQNLGLPIEITLEKLAGRVPLMDVQFFVAAVILQKRTGGNLAEILEKLAVLIRERFKIRTISAHGRLSSLVLTAIPSVVAVMMYFVNRDHMQFFVDEYAGQWMAGIALAFQGLGYFIMRQIVKIEV
jgi:tight adherence protein B